MIRLYLSENCPDDWSYDGNNETLETSLKPLLPTTNAYKYALHRNMTQEDSNNLQKQSGER